MTHAEKEKVIASYSDKYHVFVETGTFQGDMAIAMAKHFPMVHTIEIDEQLFKSARLKAAEVGNIKFHLGPSWSVFSVMLDHIDEPVLFYLDAHSPFGQQYYGNPLLDEIKLILNNSVLNPGNQHTIIIDDIDLFGKHDFPTRQEVDTLLSFRKNYEIKNLLISEPNA